MGIENDVRDVQRQLDAVTVRLDRILDILMVKLTPEEQQKLIERQQARVVQMQSIPQPPKTVLRVF